MASNTSRGGRDVAEKTTSTVEFTAEYVEARDDTAKPGPLAASSHESIRSVTEVWHLTVGVKNNVITMSVSVNARAVDLMKSIVKRVVRSQTNSHANFDLKF